MIYETVCHSTHTHTRTHMSEICHEVLRSALDSFKCEDFALNFKGYHTSVLLNFPCKGKMPFSRFSSNSKDYFISRMSIVCKTNIT